MPEFYCAASACTPEINLDLSKSHFSIKGESYPADALGFYKPVVEALKVADLANGLDVEVRLSYLDSTTSHFLSLIFEVLEEHKQTDKVQVKWYFPNDDDDIRECGEDYDHELELPFQLIGY